MFERTPSEDDTNSSIPAAPPSASAAAAPRLSIAEGVSRGLANVAAGVLAAPTGPNPAPRGLRAKAMDKLRGRKGSSAGAAAKEPEIAVENVQESELFRDSFLVGIYYTKQVMRKASW